MLLTAPRLMTMMALPAMLLAVPTASVPEAERCSMIALPRRPPSIFFLGTASADVRQAPARGAGDLVEESITGNVPGHVFDTQRIGGTDVGRLPPGASRILVVPWGYSADCRP